MQARTGSMPAATLYQPTGTRQAGIMGKQTKESNEATMETLRTSYSTSAVLSKCDDSPHLCAPWNAFVTIYVNGLFGSVDDVETLWRLAPADRGERVQSGGKLDSCNAHAFWTLSPLSSCPFTNIDAFHHPLAQVRVLLIDTRPLQFHGKPTVTTSRVLQQWSEILHVEASLRKQSQNVFQRWLSLWDLRHAT